MAGPTVAQLAQRDLHLRASCPDSSDLSDAVVKWNVFCDTNMAGLDFPPEDGRRKANSLAECVGFCARHNPFCWAAVWDPENRLGALNCWLKSSQGGTSELEGVQFARLYKWENATNDCDDIGTTYSSTDGTAYNVSCGTDINVPDVEQLPTQSMAECMDLCSETDNCAAVVYQADRHNALYNCFLKSTFDQERSRDTSTLLEGVFDSAQRLGFQASSSGTTASIPSHSTSASRTSIASMTSSTNSSTGASSSDKKGDEGSSNNTGAIAGGVSGGFLGLILIGLGIFLWARRKKHKNHPKAEELAGRAVSNDVKSAAPAYSTPAHSPPVEIGSSYNEATELPGHPYR